MALDFPASPSVGQVFSGAGGTWKWDGGKWVSATAATTGGLSLPVQIAQGGTGATTASQALINLGAIGLNSPAFTGTPTAPTPTAGDNSTNIATTAFVTTAAGAYVPLAGGTMTGQLTNTASLTVNANTAALPPGTQTNLLHIGGADTTLPSITMDAFGTGALSVVSYRTARGTAAAPSATQGADILGYLDFYGRGASGYGTFPGVRITSVAAENYSDTAQGASLRFSTITPGATTLATRVAIGPGVQIGAPTGGDLGNGTLNVAGVIRSTGIVGVVDGSSAAAGNVGEVITASFAAASLTTGTIASLGSISLTAGDWDVFGSVAFTISAAASLLQASSSSSATAMGTPLMSLASTTASLGSDALMVPMQRFNVTATTNVYLVAAATFASGTATAAGTLYARRKR